MQWDKIQRKGTVILKSNKQKLFFHPDKIFKFWHSESVINCTDMIKTTYAYKFPMQCFETVETGPCI